MRQFIEENLANRFPPEAEPTYTERIAALKERKLAATADKVEREGGLDEDDYGRIVPPAGFSWRPIPNHPDGSFYGYDGWATNFADLLARHPLYVDPVDAMAGKWMFFLSRMKGPTWKPDFDYSPLKPDFERYGIIDGIGKDGHFAPDYAVGLELGWGGLLRKLDEFAGVNGESAFYAAERQAVRAIQGWISRTCSLVAELARIERNPTIRRNLLNMLAANERIVSGPPTTLREACQWICWYNMSSRTYNRDGAGCQLDELLRPYYEADLAAGAIDDDAARFYLACLLLNDTHYYQLGGPDEGGRDLTSRISYLVLEAADLIDCSCNLTIRVHDGLDQAFFEQSIGYLFKNKNGWPRYSGDAALVEGFARCGFPRELGRRRIAVGCHWMSLPGLEYTMNDLVKVNLAKVFELVFFEVVDALGDGSTVADVWEAFARHLRLAVAAAARGIDFHVSHQAENEPELVLNLLSHGPVERGLDVTEGGAEYLNLAIDGAGIGTVADSFSALERRVESEEKLSWTALAELLRSDFAGPGGEAARSLLRRGGRYCEGGSAGDRWAVAVSEEFSAIVRAQNGAFLGSGYNFIPGLFSWADTIRLGEAVGATPNGRKARAPINHGANPEPGFRADGAVTALAEGVISVQPGYGNTAPIQLEFDPRLAEGEEAVRKIAALVRTMFRRGATLLNINIVDKSRLLKAHADPSLYPDLVVRVTGFTAYFSMLSPRFRQLVVDRLLESP